MKRKMDIEFEIWMLKDIIDSFERSIKRLKTKPKTRKRKFYIKQYESTIEVKKKRIEELENQGG